MEIYPNAVTKDCHQKILNQMNNPIYKIKKEDGKFEFCFFCYIKTENKNIPVLLTTYEIINEIYIKNNNSIKVLINDEFINIKFGDKKYFNKENDLSIIEIQKVKRKKIYFFQIDDNLYQKDFKGYYNKKSIYILNYNNENDVSVSYGIINYINKSKLLFSCNINTDLKVLPIFNLSNNKFIGIYTSKSIYYNKGIILGSIINELIDIYFNNKNLLKLSKNNISEIELTINVDRMDVNQNMYFLDNYVYRDENNIIHYHDNLKEINELNTKLYINKKQYDFKKYFKPEIKGDYIITLIFNKNITDCSYMFSGCKNITKIDCYFFNTMQITNMKYMFYECENLKDINLFSFDTKNVIDMSYMFSGCKRLNNLDLSSFDTKNVTDISYMFYGCFNLNNIDLSFFKTNKVNKMCHLFHCCYNLSDLNLKSFNTQNVNDMSFTFYKCKNLRNIYSFTFDINNVDDMSFMFLYCDNLNKQDLSYLKSKQIEYINKQTEIIEKKPNNEIDIIININEIDIDNNIYFLDNDFKHNKLKELNEYNTELYIDENKYSFKKFFIPKKIGKYIIKLKFKINLTDCSFMFGYCKNIIGINFINFNTKNVTNMEGMFGRCINLKKINLSSFNTKNVKNMSFMFYDCYNLTYLDLSSFDTRNVKNMSYMFAWCKNLINLDLSYFDTKNVTNMSQIFSRCTRLNNLDLSNFNVKNVTNIDSAFYRCEAVLKSNLIIFENFPRGDMTFI